MMIELENKYKKKTASMSALLKDFGNDFLFEVVDLGTSEKIQIRLIDILIVTYPLLHQEEIINGVSVKFDTITSGIRINFTEQFRDRLDEVYPEAMI